jgi:hypothetical protein
MDEIRASLRAMTEKLNASSQFYHEMLNEYRGKLARAEDKNDELHTKFLAVMNEINLKLVKRERDQQWSDRSA